VNTVQVKPIRTEDDYEAALARLEEIAEAEPGTPESDEFDVLAALLDRYEEQNFHIPAPTPLGAIRFRMEQQGLTPRDMEPILGSRSRVSEVLNGTRPLSLDMIRALNLHLGIPAEALLGGEASPEQPRRLPKPVEQRLTSWGLMRIGESLAAFVERATRGSPALAMLRQTRSDRTNAKTDAASMQAWCAGALVRSEEAKVDERFDANRLGRSMRDIARLSASEDGPARVPQELAGLGVAFVVVPTLPGTHLDGAAMLRADGVPVVALSLRRDQVDSFWFTLMHELAHVWKHIGAGRPAIIDDLDIGSSSKIEREADRIAEEALIPPDLWRGFNQGEYTSKAEVEALAAKAGVHPAIVAGRWRLANRNYQRFSRMLGHRTVRVQFAGIPGVGC
jgi:HTH-type transcriptional regulator/antitoxin HigA